MATTAQMPMCTEKATPSFNPDKQRELICYLQDLDDHFSPCAINDLDKRRKWALRYVPLDVADLWEGMPDWAKATDWDALKVVMQKHYPASTDTQ